MSTSPPHRPPPVGEGWVLALASAAIILTPYLTVALPYRTALVVQAGSILAITLAALAWGLTRPHGVARLRHASGTVQLAVALYAGAAVLGTVVGLARGSSLTFLIGQALSMGLLGLGVAAGLTLGGRRWLPYLAWGTVGGVSLAALIHFGHWGVSLVRGGHVFRLYLPNMVSATGAALFALAFACGLALAWGSGRRAAAALAMVISSLFIVGSGVRSLWLVTPGALALCLALSGHTRSLRRPRTWLVVSALAVLGTAGALFAVHQWRLPRPNLVPAGNLNSEVPSPSASHSPGPGGTGASTARPAGARWLASPERRSHVFVRRFPAGSSEAYRMRAVLEGSGTGSCRLSLDWFGAGARGRWLLESWSQPVGAGIGPRSLSVTSVPPGGTAQAQIRIFCDGQVEGLWTLHEVAVHRFGWGPGALALTNAHFLVRRVQAGWTAVRGNGPIADSSIAARFAETSRLFELFREAPLGAKLFGHGLGATYPFSTQSLDELGRPIRVERPNYIHNFYLFLLYKLGIVGGGAALSALLLALAVAFRGALRESDPHVRPLLAAAAAIWLGYLVWSLACPQILDFRTAPLFGLLMAAAARGAPSTAPEARR